jgi:beta-glucosidase
MKRSAGRTATIVVVTVILSVGSVAASAAKSPKKPSPGAAPTATTSAATNPVALQRANDLLAAMTRDQKIAIALNDFSTVGSLGIPAFSWQDGPIGIRTTGTTSLPSGQALAATFNRTLAREFGDVIGAEARGKGYNEWLGPAMDIARTPLAGRQPENLGEDPFLAGHTAAQEVLGAKSDNVIAVLKHYVANNQEWGRIGLQIGPSGFIRSPGVNVHVAERTLQEIYERPFHIALGESGADGVMCSYNRVNGVPDFGFAVRDPLGAALAGTDVPALNGAGGRTAAMFTSGQVPPERLDDIVRRILYGMIDSGVLDNPLPAPAADVSSPEHRALATRVAEAGMVLLKNTQHALPLSDHVGSIALIGPTGDDAMYVTGGSASVPPEAGEAITPRAGITARAGAGTQVNAVQGSAGDVPAPAIVPSSVLAPSSGSGPGLLGTYWNNGDFSGAPVLTRVDPTVDLNSAPSETGGLWSARWTGTLTPTESGLHRFSLLLSGLGTLTIAGHKFGPAYREGTRFVAGPLYPVQGAVRLEAGKPVPVTIDYSSRPGLFGQEIHFGWQQPSQSGIPAAVAAAKQADVAIVFANNAQGEGMDRPTLALPGDQNELISAVAAANKRTVVVLNTGGPVLMPWLGDVDAVLQAWYPGERFGEAVAAVLFGDTDASGHLPVTFPASDEQGPAPPTNPQRYPGVNLEEQYDEGMLVGYRWYDSTGQRPLFPFGYGLSYANFHVSRVSADFDESTHTATVHACIKNTSARSGTAVLQLYLASPAAGEPPRQLKGYANVELGQGESQTVEFKLGQDELAYYGGSGWAVAPGRYGAFVGLSSADLAHRASFTVRG